jgi:drug/metabolite transporter (DMT)-like permease
MAAYTICETIIPWYFLSSAEQTLPSSTAGLLLAAVPLAGVAVAFAFAMGRSAQLTAVNWAGIGVGMLGVDALVGLDVAGSDLGRASVSPPSRSRGRRSGNR